MYIRRFSGQEDFETLCAWLKARCHFLPEPDEMPYHGFVACERGEPIAMGFLRRVEGGYGQYDGLTSNPDAPGDLRSVALDAVIDEVIETAKKLKLRGLMAFTHDKNTHARAIRHGFAELPQAMVVGINTTTSGK